NGWKIPLERDGTTLINPAAQRSVRRVSLNELLLAAQERDRHHAPTRDLSNLRNQIVLLRLEGDPLEGPNIFASAIATIQSNAYIRPAGAAVAWLVIAAAAVLAAFYRMISRWSLVVGAILFSAGYGIAELTLLSHNRLWLPFVLPFILV